MAAPSASELLAHRVRDRFFDRVRRRDALHGVGEGFGAPFGFGFARDAL